jgi:HPt (histidine-containing phosphotransfer) domain-containing protein
MQADRLQNLITAMDALRDRFVGTLPERIATISRACADLRRGHTTPAEIGRLFHALCGTAATYGLSTISSICAEAEELCEQDDFGVEEEAYLRTLVRDLRSGFAHVGATPVVASGTLDERAMRRRA